MIDRIYKANLSCNSDMRGYASDPINQIFSSITSTYIHLFSSSSFCADGLMMTVITGNE